MKYKGFLSYKHGDDDALANGLEKALEKFAKPTFKRRAIEIFRDGNDLSAAADLGEKIRNGLIDSEYFICMASPTYAQSKWCCREAEFWRDNKEIDNFLIVLTAGDIQWDETKNDFDWSVTTALPKELSGVFSGEPFYIDFRNAGPKEQLNLDNPDFKTRLVMLAATLHNKSVGDMVGEAAKQFKRTMRIRNATIAVLSALLFVAVASALYAVNQKNKALLSTYIANSQAQFNEDPTKSLRLAEHAYKFAKEKNFSTKEASEQLIKVFYSGYGFYQEPLSNLPEFLENETSAIANDGSAASNGILRLTDSIMGSVPADGYLRNNSDLYFDASNNNAIYVVSSNATGYSRIYYITDGVYIASSDIIVSGFSGYTGYIQDIDISEDGKYTLLGSANGKTALIDNEAYRINPEKNIFKDRAILKSSVGFPVEEVTFLNEGEYIATESFDSEYINGIRKDKERTVYFYKTVAFPYIEMYNAKSEFGNSSIDNQYYMVPSTEETDPFSWFHYAQVIKNYNGDILAEFPNATGLDLEAILNPERTFSVSYKGVFNVNNELLITLNLDRIDNPGIAYCFSTDGKFVKISYLDGLQRIFALEPEFIIDRMNNPDVMGHIPKLNRDDKVRFLINE